MEQTKAKKPRKLKGKERVARQTEGVMNCFKAALLMFSEKELLQLRDGRAPYKAAEAKK